MISDIHGEIKMRMVTIFIGENCTDENRLVGPDAQQSDFGQNETPETATVSGAFGTNHYKGHGRPLAIQGVTAISNVYNHRKIEWN